MPRNDDWKVFLGIHRNRPDVHAKPEEVVTKLVAEEAAIVTEAVGVDTGPRHALRRTGAGV